MSKWLKYTKGPSQRPFASVDKDGRIIDGRAPRYSTLTTIKYRSAWTNLSPEVS